MTALTVLECLGSVSYAWNYRHKLRWSQLRVKQVGASRLRAVDCPNRHVIEKLQCLQTEGSTAKHIIFDMPLSIRQRNKVEVTPNTTC